MAFVTATNAHRNGLTLVPYLVGFPRRGKG
jgi:hypothetical protein